MACRNAYRIRAIRGEASTGEPFATEPKVAQTVNRLLFGADSKTEAYDVLQNNMQHFDWIVCNKIYPNFCGRYLNGENHLTKEEIRFLHTKGCKIAAIYTDQGEKQTEQQGKDVANKAKLCAFDLEIPRGSVIFLEIDDHETASRDFMRGFAMVLIDEGYTPGFKANTDARFTFDREFSRGMQNDREIFKRCLVWATSPTVKEYDGITTSHLIHPDNWIPYAPSGITRKEIAIWQYGKDCHPIEDDKEKLTTFNLDLVRNEQVIVDKLF